MHAGCHLLHVLGFEDVGTVKDVVLHYMAWPVIAVGTVQTLWLWRGIHWRLLLVGGPLMACGSVAGTILLLRYGASLWLKRAVGAMLLAMWLDRQSKSCKQSGVRSGGGGATGAAAPDEPPPGSAPEPTRRARDCLSVAWWFSLAGLLSGLTGVAGPALMLFVSHHRAVLNRHTWRSTSAATVLIMGGVRLTVAAVAGTASSQARASDVDGALPQLFMCACALLGLAVGNALSKRLSAAAFHSFILFFLLSGSLLLASAGFGILERLAQLTLLVAAPFYFLPRGVLAQAQRRWCSRCGPPSWLATPGTPAKPLAACDAAAELQTAAPSSALATLEKRRDEAGLPSTGQSSSV